jgi:hypothetical protein
MNYRQAWAPDAGLDIFGLGISRVLEDELCHLLDRQPPYTHTKLGCRVAWSLFENSDRHAGSDHPIAQAALERSQVPRSRRQG